MSDPIKITGLPKVGKTGWGKVFLDFLQPLRIQSKEVSDYEGRGCKLDLWGSQKIYLDQMASGMDRGIRDFYCLKSRQLGITTISLAIDLFWLATHPGILGVLVTENEQNRDIFRITIRNYYDSLPEEFVGTGFRKIKDNAACMEWSNGSRLDFLVAGRTKKTWGEGRGYALAHLTEVAKYGTPEGISSFRETLATSNPDRLSMWESTAFGMNHWKDMTDNAFSDRYTKHGFFIGWWSKELNSFDRKDARWASFGALPPTSEEKEKIEIVRQRHGVSISMEQLAWRRWRDADTSTSKSDLDQNQPWTSEEAFVQSGANFFAPRAVSKILERIYDTATYGIVYYPYRFYLGHVFYESKMEPIDPGEISAKGTDIVELRVWENPVEGATYVIGCDPAFGRNDWKDRSCISVWRCYANKLVQVAEYADNRVETYQVAWVLAYLAGFYKNCIVNIELTGGVGLAVFKELDDKRIEYRGEYHQARFGEDKEENDFLSTARYYMWRRPDSMGKGFAYHTQLSGRYKFQWLNQLRDSLLMGFLDIKSAPMLEEMLTVVQDGSDISAPGRMKDDRVFATMYAHMAWKDHVQASMISRGQTYEAVSASENETGPTANSAVTHIVKNFWKRAEEAMNNLREEPMSYFDQRGG